MHELDAFHDDGWIADVLHTVKSGKEATVYCCKGGTRAEAGLIAAKVYRPRAWRSFKNDAVYQEGRVIVDRRLRRAVAKKTQTGRGCQSVCGWTRNTPLSVLCTQPGRTFPNRMPGQAKPS